MKILNLLAVTLQLLTFNICAQQYSIDWHKVSGGGGTSSNGQYSVSGTTGQSDAGAMNGGNYSLTGGFWALYAVQVPGSPSLRIFLSGPSTAVVAWPAPSAGFVLQQNDNLSNTNGWFDFVGATNVVGSENRVVISPPTGILYFRLRK